MKHTRSHPRGLRRMRARTMLMLFLCAWTHTAIAQKANSSPKQKIFEPQTQQQQPEKKTNSSQKQKVVEQQVQQQGKGAMQPAPTSIYDKTKTGRTEKKESGPYTPGGFLDNVVDRLGNRYSLEDIRIKRIFPDKDDQQPHGKKGEKTDGNAPMMMAAAGCASGYFQMWLEPGCGLDGTDPASVARRDVLCQVLTDLSNFIQSPLTGGTQRINIWVRNPASLTGLPSAYAGVASSFYSMPNLSTPVRGIVDNATWITLNSGRDAYTNVTSPLVTTDGAGGSTFFHAWVAVNSLMPWNTNLAGLPASGDIDLYSVLLHEMMHALGFGSNIRFDGASRFSPLGYNYYNRYDQFLRTAGMPSQPLITSTSLCTNMYGATFNPLVPLTAISPGCPGAFQTGPEANHSNCTNAIRYVDGAMTQEVYTPDCFENFSSLSHFTDECLQVNHPTHPFVLSHPSVTDWNCQYFVMCMAARPGPFMPSTPGAMRRFPTNEERQVLCDIGYRVNTTYGSTTNLNFEDYAADFGATGCGNIIAGINDGINSAGAYAFFSTGGAVNINSGIGLLGNDHGADSFSCLEVISGSGLLSATAGISGAVVTYTPAASDHGVQLLRYVPVNIATGAQGNITYIYVYVGEAGCTPEACNLVSNGGIEDVIPGSVGEWQFLAPGAVHCWDMFTETPNLMTRGAAGGFGIPTPWTTPPTDTHPFSIGTNDHMLHIECSNINGGPNWSESAQTGLTSDLIPGQNYTISCWAKLLHLTAFPFVDNHMIFAVSPSAAPLAHTTGGFAALPAGLDQIWDLTVRVDHGDGWRYYEQTFTYTGTQPGRRLIVMSSSFLDPYTVPFVFGNVVDDITIKPATAVCSFSVPPVVCIGGVATLNLNDYVSIPGGTFSWETTPVVSGVATVSHSATFNVMDAYNASIAMGGVGIVNICYDYTDGSGCTQQVCTVVDLTAAGGPDVITGPTAVCQGSTIVLANTTLGGTWTSSDPSATIDPVTGVVTGVSTGSAVITYTMGSGCYSTLLIAVFPATPITGPSNVCVGSSIHLANITPGGTWASAGLFTLPGASGDVIGIAPGIEAVTYTLPGGCFATAMITVLASPDAITGAFSLCEGGNTFLSNLTPGGVWSSSDPLVASIDPLGLVNAHHAGTTTISYTLPSGCSATATFIVNPAPGPISGVGPLCVGSTITLGNAVPGGSWTEDPSATNAHFITGGILYGDVPGAQVVRYTLPGGCFITVPIQVFPTPPAISGPSSVCVNQTITLSEPAGGGSWTVPPTTSAVFGLSTPTDLPITGANAGSFTITYSYPGGCSVTKTIVVNPSPDPIFGPVMVCVGQTVTYSSLTLGGVWSSNPLVLPIGASTGIATGFSAGVALVSYTLSSTGCSTTRPVQVMPTPTITEAPYTAVCVGGTTTLHASIPGGSWSVASGTAATVDPMGVVTAGSTPGSVTISYTLPTTCGASVVVYVTDPFNVTVCETAPISTCDDKLTFCGSGFTITVSGAPAGSTYSWSPSISGYSSMSSSVSGGIVTNTYIFSSLAATTTYTVSSSLSCGTPRVVTIVKPAGTCYPCGSFVCSSEHISPAFKTVTATTLDGSVISASTPGIYYIHNDASLTVDPAPGSVFVMGAGVNITIPNTENITIDNCHMFSRADGVCRWEGITVQANATASGRLKLSHSLIEHASVAGVRVNPGSAVAALPAGDIINSDNTIFNNNLAGISIKFYSNHNTLPFHVQSSVFTARNWGCYSVGEPSSTTDYYPYVWPSASYLKAPNSSFGSPNDPGFNIDLFTARDGSDKFGIDMMDVGKTDLGTPNTYHYMTIGNPNHADSTNMFDTIQTEMRLYDCNVICYNNIFRHPNEGDHQAYGILALNAGAVGYPNQNRTSLQLLPGSVAGTHNRFYACSTAAIHAQYYYNFKSNNTLISASNYKLYNHSTTPPTVATSINGYYGMHFIDSAFDYHEVQYDTIRNVQIGIQAILKTNVPHVNGDYLIMNNEFSGLTSSSGTEYGESGMNIYDGNITTTAPNGALKLVNNFLSGWLYGMTVETNNVDVTIDDNVVKIRSNGDPHPQVGIAVDNSTFINQLSHNEVYGDIANGVSYNTPVPKVEGSLTTTRLNGVIGFYFDNVTNTSSVAANVVCNGVHDVSIGFKFDNTNKLYWRGNSMKRNRYGMLLNYYYALAVPHNAIIGDQGASCDPSDNSWDDDLSVTWPGWGGTATGSVLSTTTIYQTYVMNQNPASTSPSSKLYVRTGSASEYIPTFNGVWGSAAGTAAYSTGGGSIIGTANSCSPTALSCFAAAYRMVTTGTPEQSTLGTVNEVKYTVIPNPNNGDMTIQKTSTGLVDNVANVRVVNAVGQVVFDGKLNFESGSADLKLGEVASGLYFVHIEGKNEEAAIFKVVIQK